MPSHFADEPEHIGLPRETLRRFVAAEMPPEKRQQWDREHRFPCELFAKLAALGVCGLTIDEANGGAGRDLVAAVAVIEELCRGGAFAAGPFIHCAFYGGMNISENGSEAQKRALLPRLARGELLFAYGLSEPDVGGDLASVRTTARVSADGRQLVLNGSKRWCTGAEFADFIYCLVRTGPEDARYQNLSFVRVDPKGPGISIAPIEHMNLRYTLSSDVCFDDAPVPIGNVVGGPDALGRGWKMLAGRGEALRRGHRRPDRPRRQRGMGAYGLSEGHDMERNVRDLLGMPIVGGSSAMQKNNLARRWGLPE